MLGRCEVAGMSCLDVGAMEGLVPELLTKRRACRVTAVDFSDHCLGKLAVVQHYHGVDFEFRSVGLMYDLHRRLARRSYDLVTCQGSCTTPFLRWGFSQRPGRSFKRRGFMLLSTSVTLGPEHSMDCNVRGR
jgi:hypothetical protein